jgi:ribosome-associated toxin RatA of RatAB toxin-antitoxin module
MGYYAFFAKKRDRGGGDMQRGFSACLAGLLLIAALCAGERSMSMNPDFTDFMGIYELRQGKVQLKNIKETSFATGRVIKGTESRILICAPAEKVWRVLDNKENIPKFISQVKSAQVLQSGENLQTVKTSIKICRLLPTFDYVICFDRSSRYRKMAFKKTDGCFKELYGCFEFIPCGNSTILGYRIFADPGFYIPEFIQKLVNSDAEKIMRAIKEEAEK